MFRYINHHQADISVHEHDMFSPYSMGSRFVYICCIEFQAFRQTPQYLISWLTYSLLHVSNHHQADISVHGHDMFSTYSMGYHIVYICCVEFQAFRQINCSIFNILTNVFSEISMNISMCSAPEYGRSSVDLTYRSVGTTGRDSQENSQWHR